MKNILAINPTQLVTKIGVYRNHTPLYLTELIHPHTELEKFQNIEEQDEYRAKAIISQLKKGGFQLEDIDIIMARGGFLKPSKSGVYFVNENVVRDLRMAVLGHHASNLGGLIAHILDGLIPAVKAYIVDPVTTDELQGIARIAGHPEFKRLSVFHSLNQKSIARRHARSLHKKYEELNLIVAHLGMGISIGAHKKGRVVDVNQAYNGEGPFSPERSGTLPVGDLVKLCYSGKYTLDEMLEILHGKGGLKAYLGTNSALAVEKDALSGRRKAKQIYDAMAYQVAKNIGSLATVLSGKVDGILLTGGIAHNKYFVDYIKNRVAFIAPVSVYPGEDEMSALVMNGVMVLSGEIEVRKY